MQPVHPRSHPTHARADARPLQWFTQPLLNKQRNLKASLAIHSPVAGTRDHKTTQAHPLLIPQAVRQWLLRWQR